MNRHEIARQTAQEFRMKKWPFAISSEMAAFMQYCEAMEALEKTSGVPEVQKGVGWRPRENPIRHCELCKKEIGYRNKCGVCYECQHPNRRKCKDCGTLLFKGERPEEYEKKQCKFCTADEARLKAK